MGIAYVFLPNSYNGPCITESAPRVFELILKKNNYKGDYFLFELQWNESLAEYYERVKTNLLKIIKEHSKTVVFGGNHLSILPVYQTVGELGYNSLTLDAHRDYLFNDGKITHGSFFRFVEKRANHKTIVGFRDVISDDDKYNFFDLEIPCSQLKKNKEINCLNKINFVDIDVDVLDKKVFPYTVCAAKNGLSLKQLYLLLNHIEFNKSKILAFSEYAYILDKKKKGIKIILDIIGQYISD